MKIIKIILALILIPLICQMTLALIINQTDLSKLSYKDYNITGQYSSDCINIEFEKNLQINTVEDYTILSLHLTPSPKSGFEGTVKLNQETKLIPFNHNDYYGGWVRIILPNEKIKEKNTAKICVTNTHKTEVTTIHSDSKIGTYRIADFYKPDSIEKSIDDTPKINQELRINLTVRNYGSENKEIDINYQKKVEEENPELEIISPTMTKTQIVPKCQQYDLVQKKCVKPGEITTTYRVKPNISGPMTILPSTISFLNEFGQLEIIESNPINIKVFGEEGKLEPFIILDKTYFEEHEKIIGRLGIRNRSDQIIKDIRANVEIDEDNQQFELTHLMPKDTKYFTFALDGAPGKHKIKCYASRSDISPPEIISCQGTNIEIEKKELPLTIILGLTMTAIGAAIYFILLKT